MLTVRSTAVAVYGTVDSHIVLPIFTDIAAIPTMHDWKSQRWQKNSALGKGSDGRRANTLYDADDAKVFWRHHDDEDPNCDPIT